MKHTCSSSSQEGCLSLSLATAGGGRLLLASDCAPRLSFKGLGVYAQDCVAKWGPVRRQLAAPKPSRVRVPS
jgi:hypothetical protein